MKPAALAPFLLLAAAVACFAQRNGFTELLDSPVKADAEIYRTGGTIAATLPLSGSLFGASQRKTSPIGSSPAEFLIGDLFVPFTVFDVDETPALLASWPTVFPGTTMTGITVDSRTGGNTYWAVDAFQTGTLIEFIVGTGLPGPAIPVPLPPVSPGVWGPLALDNNQPGAKAYVEEIVADLYVEVDLTTGAVGCSFPNPDNSAGGGAFGNGLDDAEFPGACSGTTLVFSSGLPAETQVTRISQGDCSGTLCYNTWEIGTALSAAGETFPNGVVEYSSGTQPCGFGPGLAVAGNATTTFFVLCRPIGIGDCQGLDSPDSDDLFANGSRGGPGFTVPINNTAPLGLAMQKPPAGGNGKYVVHMDSGSPSSGTITALPAGLGSSCFAFLLPPSGSAAPVSVWNNLGKTSKVGASNYFGVAISNPAKAPAFFHTDAAGDAVNLTLGSQWTLQGIIINPAASSPKLASLTNGVILDVTAGI